MVIFRNITTIVTLAPNLGGTLGFNRFRNSHPTLQPHPSQNVTSQKVPMKLVNLVLCSLYTLSRVTSLVTAATPVFVVGCCHGS